MSRRRRNQEEEGKKGRSVEKGKPIFRKKIMALGHARGP